MVLVKASSQEAVLDHRGICAKFRPKFLSWQEQMNSVLIETMKRCVCVEGTELALLAHNFWFWSVLCSVA